MTSEECLFLPDGSDERSVHRQSINRGSSGGAESDENGPVPAEMLVPCVTTRIEECDARRRFGIGCCVSSSFSERARYAGKCEVIDDGFAACGHGLYVIYMKRSLLPDLG